MKQLHFDTDAFPPHLRLDALARTTVEYRVEALCAPEDFSMRATATVVGALIVVDAHVAPVRCIRTVEQTLEDRRDYFSFFLLYEGEATVIFDPDEPPSRIVAGEMFAMDRSRPVDGGSPVPVHIVLLLFPRHWLEEVLPGIRLHQAIHASPALRIAMDHAARLVAALPDLGEEAASLYARSLRDLFAAAIVDQLRGDLPEGRPVATLLGRVVAHIDEHLAEALDAEVLGRSLGVSRSSLYRAARPAGGVTALIRQRRLMAVHRQLADPADSRPIATIAQACGFVDIPQFSRQFRRAFGETAGEVRARGGPRLPELADDGSVQQRYRTVVDALASDRGRSLP